MKAIIRNAIQKTMPLLYNRMAEAKILEVNKYIGTEYEHEYETDGKYRLGILKDYAQWHRHYIAACIEMRISYRILDIYAEDWLDIIQNSGCDGILVWMPAAYRVHKEMIEERLSIIREKLKIEIFPTYNELWIWGSKRRMAYWMLADNIQTPVTMIYYDMEAAIKYADNCSLPVVIKTDFGDSSRGVWIVKKRRKAKQLVRKAFSFGLNSRLGNRFNKEYGTVLFQQYIDRATEWRLIRVKDSFFGYKKKLIGNYASGHGIVEYGEIPVRLLQLIRDVTERNQFHSMSMDVLVKSDSSFYVTEIQSLFGDPVGGRKLVINGLPGRYRYNEIRSEWFFEKGVFDQNHCCNLRVEELLSRLDKKNARN